MQLVTDTGILHEQISQRKRFYFVPESWGKRILQSNRNHVVINVWVGSNTLNFCISLAVVNDLIMGPSFLEGGSIMYRCCPSVCLSVPCLHLQKKRKGLRIPNLVGRIAGTRATRGPISRSKGHRTR